MIRNLKGLILDDKKPIEFAVIYRSDINGKLITNPTLTSKSDENGFWILNGLSNTDYITARLLGYDTKTISVANFLSDTINIPLKKSSVILEEVEIIDNAIEKARELFYKHSRINFVDGRLKKCYGEDDMSNRISALFNDSLGEKRTP